MTQITKVSKQKKRERFNIFLDDTYAFSVNNFTLLENNLKVGKTLSEDDVSRIIKKEQASSLNDLAVKFLSFRPRSEKELRDYLIKKISQKNEIKFSDASKSPLIETVINKLKKYNYVNDEDFAKWWVDSRTKSKSPKSLRIIKLELKAKGVPQEILESVLKGSPNETSQAIKALEKRYERWKSLDETSFKKKTYSYLQAKGFDFDTIGDAIAFFLKKR